MTLAEYASQKLIVVRASTEAFSSAQKEWLHVHEGPPQLLRYTSWRSCESVYQVDLPDI